MEAANECEYIYTHTTHTETRTTSKQEKYKSKENNMFIEVKFIYCLI